VVNLTYFSRYNISGVKKNKYFCYIHDNRSGKRRNDITSSANRACLRLVLIVFIVHKQYVHCHLVRFQCIILKNHQRIPCKREGKQTFICIQTRPAILKSPILQSKNNRCDACVPVCNMCEV